ncbi:MAG: hypothetical protein HY909_24855 [Deltaproteobacteria bacterium]|nr:hypothetical protein [Deltaproteobacteria bacterium]
MRTWVLVVALAGACGGGAGTAPDMQEDAGAPSAPLMAGMYTPRTDIDAEVALVAALTNARTASGMFQWDAIDTAVAPTAPLGAFLARLDQEFLGASGAQGEYALTRTVREALVRGRAATTDDARGIAKQGVEKPLLVALGLGVTSELRLARAAAREGQWVRASRAWDRAAAYLSGLHGNLGTRSSTSANGVWGASVMTLTDENMAERTLALLVRGRAGLDARSVRTVVETSAEASAYVTKYYFLSGLNYAHEVRATLAMMRDATKVFAEGRYFFEGVVLPNHGRSDAEAVRAARARWRGEPSALDRAEVLRDSAALYALGLRPAVEALASADASARQETLALLSGTVDALDEALGAAGQDVPALRARLVEARTRADAGDGAAAATLARAVLDAIQGLAARGS